MEKKIKVLMIGRDTMYTSPGGDTTQMEMTAKYLRELTVEVDVRQAKTKMNYAEYQLIHFFNIIRPDDILAHITTAVPKVISTIYVDYSEFEKEQGRGLLGFALAEFSPGQIEYIKAIARFLLKGDKIKSLSYLINGHVSSIKRVAKQASILLPNSHSEFRRLNKDYNIKQAYQKVVNAIDHRIFDYNKVIPNQKYNGHVICVGRIEGRKNQLNLIQALVNTDFQLTIIGKPSPNQMGYYEKCKKLAGTGSNVHFLSQTDHEGLASIYKAAKVHVLPSWFETTGLSSLEGGAMGCNLVITEKGDTREYFSDMAYYCDPNSIKSIYEAVARAYYAPINSELKNFILNNYTWEKTAQQTLAAYKQVLK